MLCGYLICLNQWRLFTYHVSEEQLFKDQKTLRMRIAGCEQAEVGPALSDIIGFICHLLMHLFPSHVFVDFDC